MKLKSLICFAFVAMLSVSACKKNSTSPAPKKVADTAADIYLSGYYFPNFNSNVNYTVPVYFKNGMMTKLLTDSTLNAHAWSISVQGNDVYTAGEYIAKNGNRVAVYWKNETLVKLSDSTLNTDSFAIAVNGNDVYVVGLTESANNYPMATYWKNGVAKILTNDLNDAVIYAIAINGSDIYLGGFSGNDAVYWKNDVIVKLPASAANNQVNAIAISGNDIYMVGYSVPYVTGLYWKNGVATKLTDTTSLAYDDIAVSGNDVYIAGIKNYDITNNNYDVIATWKNGIATVIPRTGIGSTYPNDIAINGNDIYVVSVDNGYGVCYKNGSPYYVGTKNNAQFTDIAIVSH